MHSDRAVIVILVLILAAPSAYFLHNVPPLWCDFDGFSQIHGGINEFTILHWPPLYCFGSQIPLLLGAVLDGTFFQTAFSFDEPTITEHGVFLLLIIQHLLLIAVSLFACLTLGRLSCRLMIYSVSRWKGSFARCAGNVAGMRSQHIPPA